MAPGVSRTMQTSQKGPLSEDRRYYRGWMAVVVNGQPRDGHEVEEPGRDPLLGLAHALEDPDSVLDPPGHTFRRVVEEVQVLPEDVVHVDGQVFVQVAGIFHADLPVGEGPAASPSAGLQKASDTGFLLLTEFLQKFLRIGIRCPVVGTLGVVTPTRPPQVGQVDVLSGDVDGLSVPYCGCCRGWMAGVAQGQPRGGYEVREQGVINVLLIID